MKTSQNLLVEIKDEMSLKEVNGESGWAATLSHLYNTFLNKSCSWPNFYGKQTKPKCTRGTGCTCR